MAREIQAQSNRQQGGKAVLGLLANAVFWFVVAIAVPVEAFLRPIPEIAPYAHWAPFVFYGLALWSFIRAIRTGKHWGQSRPILPPMPWPMYRNLNDQDLGAIFAYLQSLPPIANHVPEPLPPAAEVVAAAG